MGAFQSTLPAGEATVASWLQGGSHDNFNPRFPRGKRRRLFWRARLRPKISIHASRGGSDQQVKDILVYLPEFQSTLPAGEATAPRDCGSPETGISIHASRGGSDDNVGQCFILPPNFNPRFPRGKRLTMSCSASRLFNFNPRFPRGKRPQCHAVLQGCSISIHASRGGSDHQPKT